MSRIYTSMEQLIGQTPLLELVRIEREEDLKARLLVKLESFNPGGSVKDRAAKAMLDDAEARGLLQPSSSPPPAIQASAWRRWRRCGDTGWSSSCRTP